MIDLASYGKGSKYSMTLNYRNMRHLNIHSCTRIISNGHTLINDILHWRELCCRYTYLKINSVNDITHNCKTRVLGLDLSSGSARLLIQPWDITSFPGKGVSGGRTSSSSQEDEAGETHLHKVLGELTVLKTALSSEMYFRKVNISHTIAFLSANCYCPSAGANTSTGQNQCMPSSKAGGFQHL